MQNKPIDTLGALAITLFALKVSNATTWSWFEVLFVIAIVFICKIFDSGLAELAKEMRAKK